MNALFLSHQHALSAGGGGQQQCSREYQATLAAAGFNLVNVTFLTDRAPLTRLRRKFFRAPYANSVPVEFFAQVAQAVREQQPEFVFCNLYDFVPHGARLRQLLPPGTKLVLLSHGLASVDEIHAARIARHGLGARHLRPISEEWLGRMLRAEAEGLPAFDHVFCLAAFEVEICKWLGAPSASWLPRVLPSGQCLKWNPSGDRIGIVGTLDHPPNLEGAELFCAALAAARPGKMRLRIVSYSHAVVADLATRHPFVDNLGPLEKPGAVEAEAATWNAFVHPIFCYAMGCSTKLATGLTWGLPVLTSTAGLRGYAWNDGQLPRHETPSSLARAALEILNSDHARQQREEVLKAVQSAPQIHTVAAQLKKDLELP